MIIFNIIFGIISASIIVLLQLVIFSKLSKSKELKYNIRNILIILSCGFMVYINTCYNHSYTRLIVSFIFILLTSLLIFKDKISKSIIYMLFTYTIIIIYELLSTLIIINFYTLEVFNNNFVLKTLYSFLVMISGYFTVRSEKIQQFISNLAFKLNSRKIIYVLLFGVCLFLLTIDYTNYKYYKIEIYLNNIILVICASLIIVFGIYNYIKANEELEKIEILLSFIKKYEKVIDEDRILRHEILNNLLILNSFEDKNSEEYSNVLNDLINQYSKSGTKIKNLYKLPSGLKGILYYKLYGLSEEKFHINIKIDNKLSNTLKKIKKQDYIILCKIINILLDNAIEAARETRDKLINIEVYKENKTCVIMIENSCSKKVDIKKVENKYYSTKGRERGLGLYIANKLLKEHKRIILTREINNLIFTSKIVLK